MQNVLTPHVLILQAALSQMAATRQSAKIGALVYIAALTAFLYVYFPQN